MCRIQFDQVSFAYGSEIVLRNLTFDIEASQMAVIVGPNGAGKSTTLKLMAGLLKPKTGRVKIGGHSVQEAVRQGKLGYVSQLYGQNLADFPASVAEVVELGLLGKEKNLTAKGASHIVNHMLELVGMYDFRKKRIGDLSGGQQQRVLVARALAGNPELLLLDEPTSGVDPEASKAIYALLGRLNRDLGITVIMVSHDLIQATNWATKVLCINHELCFCGSSEKFRQNHLHENHLWYYSN